MTATKKARRVLNICNHNVIIKNKNLEVSGFLQTVTALSYDRNDDGEGLYCDFANVLERSEHKLNFFANSDIINKSNFILTHQRLATSGKAKEYIHPFMNEEFVLTHNGVVSQYAKEEHSDTYGLFQTFISVFPHSEGKNREEKIKNTIKSIFDELSGSFAIFIYDKVERKLYFFKDHITDINAFKSDNILYLTTSKWNNAFLTMFPYKFDEVKLNDYDIHVIEINQKNEIEIKIIGQLRKLVIEWENRNNLFNSDKPKKKKKEKPNGKPKLTEQIFLSGYGYQTLEIRKTKQQCLFCKDATFNLWVEEKSRICDDCLASGIMQEVLMEKLEKTLDDKAYKVGSRDWQNYELDDYIEREYYGRY